MPQILEHIRQMKAPQIVLWGLFLFHRHPYREGIGAGYLEGIGSRSVKVTGSPFARSCRFRRPWADEE